MRIKIITPMKPEANQASFPVIPEVFIGNP